MKIRHLVLHDINLFLIALGNQEKQGNKPNANIDLGYARSTGGFDWDKTQQGTDFWHAVQQGNMGEARAIDKALELGVFKSFEELQNFEEVYPGIYSLGRCIAVSTLPEKYSRDRLLSTPPILPRVQKDPVKFTFPDGSKSMAERYNKLIEKEKRERMKPLGTEWHGFNQDRER